MKKKNGSVLLNDWNWFPTLLCFQSKFYSLNWFSGLKKYKANYSHVSMINEYKYIESGKKRE